MLGVLLGLVLPVGHAAAHVEVSSEPAVAGASNAVVTFVAEAESDSAGVRAIQVQLGLAALVMALLVLAALVVRCRTRTDAGGASG